MTRLTRRRQKVKPKLIFKLKKKKKPELPNNTELWSPKEHELEVPDFDISENAKMFKLIWNANLGCQRGFFFFFNMLSFKKLNKNQILNKLLKSPLIPSNKKPQVAINCHPKRNDTEIPKGRKLLQPPSQGQPLPGICLTWRKPHDIIWISLTPLRTGIWQPVT